MERLGVTIGLGNGGSLRDELELCREAESLGYTDVWSAEVGGADGLSPLAAVAATTDAVRLGTAILPVFTRPPALLAMSAASLQSLSGGRFVLGLGTSSSIIVERWMGGSFEAPLTRLRDYVRAIKDLLAGEKVTFDSPSARLQGFRLQIDPGAPVPVYMAALGPRACRLAGEIADGVIFFLKSPHGVARALEWVEEGAHRAGRDASELDCVIRVPVLRSEDTEAFDTARRLIVAYAIVDVYNRSLVAQGFEKEAQAIAETWASGDRKEAVRQVSDEMIRDLLLIGDAPACRQGLQSFRAAGVRTPILSPVVQDTDPARGWREARTTLKDLARSA